MLFLAKVSFLRRLSVTFPQTTTACSSGAGVAAPSRLYMSPRVERESSSRAAVRAPRRVRGSAMRTNANSQDPLPPPSPPQTTLSVTPHRASARSPTTTQLARAARAWQRPLYCTHNIRHSLDTALSMRARRSAGRSQPALTASRCHGREVEMRTRGMHGGRAEGMEEGGSRLEHEGGDNQRTVTSRARRRALTRKAARTGMPEIRLVTLAGRLRVPAQLSARCPHQRASRWLARPR